MATLVPAPSFEMTVDRPFLLALRETRTRSLVLLGLINDPDNAKATTAKRVSKDAPAPSVLMR
jgi:hypothetical protein